MAKTYDKYKDSGIAWIGEIPSEWEVKPHKRVMRKIKEIKEQYQGEDIISLTMNGVIIRDLEAGGKMPTSFDGYQKVYPGNLLQCLFDIDVTPRCVGLIKNEGVSSPAYSQFTMLPKAEAPYYDYLLRYMDDYKTLLHLSKNLRSSLTETDFGQIETICPAVEEQQAIASFLDSKCSEIDSLISLQEEMISELQVYKQSVITEAVTKGLDQNATMKDSGVEWIGEIPEHWDVKRTKDVLSSFAKGTGITKEEVFPDGDTPCVRYGEIYSKYNYSFDKCLSKTKKDFLSSYRYFHKGDILCAGTGELVEEIGKGIVYTGDEECLAGGDIIILSPTIDSIFLNYLLNSHCIQAQKSCCKAKLKVVHISASDISSLKLVIPPLYEQEEITLYLNTKVQQIDSVIAIKQEKIQELKDYKKSIIYEYVTGKKRV